MQLSELRYFLAVLEAESFGRAAKTLRLHASTLSRAISRLEDKLGVSLVERGPSGIKITPAGRIAFRHVQQLVKDASALAETLARNGSGEYGRIRVGFHLPFLNKYLTTLLFEWHGTYPGVNVTPYEAGEDSLHMALRNNRLDVVLVPDFQMHNYEEGLPIYSEQLIGVLPNDHHLAKKHVLNWSDFDGERILLSARETEGLYSKLLAIRIAGGDFLPLDASTLSTLAFVRAGYGIMIAAEPYAKMNFSDLSFIPVAENDAYFNVNMAWRPQSEYPVVGKFVAFMRDRANPPHSRPQTYATPENPDLPA